jgi:hypothetical protein
MPGVAMRAYDIDAAARRDCAELARINDVQDRVLIADQCTPSTLAQVSEARVALLSDCEGYEKILLDPAAAPNLRTWSIIVELHENLDPTIGATIKRRFRETHEIEVVDYVRPDQDGFSELAWMTEEQVRLVRDERRPPMSWARLVPHDAEASGHRERSIHT